MIMSADPLLPGLIPSDCTTAHAIGTMIAPVNAEIASTSGRVWPNRAGVGISMMIKASAIAPASPIHFMPFEPAAGGAAARAVTVSCVVAIVGLLLIPWNRHSHTGFH